MRDEVLPGCSHLLHTITDIILPLLQILLATHTHIDWEKREGQEERARITEKERKREREGERDIYM